MLYAGQFRCFLHPAAHANPVALLHAAESKTLWNIHVVLPYAAWHMVRAVYLTNAWAIDDDMMTIPAVTEASYPEENKAD